MRKRYKPIATALLLLAAVVAIASVVWLRFLAPGPNLPPSPRALKSEISGLIDRCGGLRNLTCSPADWEPPVGFATVISGVVVNIGWADLQPVPDGGIAQDNSLDRWIARMRDLNRANPA